VEGPLGKRILQPRGLLVPLNLLNCGLADVDDRAAFECRRRIFPGTRSPIGDVSGSCIIARPFLGAGVSDLP
jgi:hypothetical protein